MENKPNTKRQPGYYWVQRRTMLKPEIGKFNGKFWRTFSLGSMKIVDESKFAWINECMIPEWGSTQSVFYSKL